MKKFFIIFLLPLFLGGKPVVFPCPCGSSSDTLPNDTMRDIMAPIIAQSVDSFREVKQGQLDSLNEIKDSLIIEVKHLKREKREKREKRKILILYQGRFGSGLTGSIRTAPDSSIRSLNTKQNEKTTHHCTMRNRAHFLPY